MNEYKNDAATDPMDLPQQIGELARWELEADRDGRTAGYASAMDWIEKECVRIGALEGRK